MKISNSLTAAMFRSVVMHAVLILLVVPPISAAEPTGTLSVCEVLENRQTYRGKMVSVRGVISSTFETFTLTNIDDSRCKGDASSITLELPEEVTSPSVDFSLVRDEDYRLFHLYYDAERPVEGPEGHFCIHCKLYQVTVTISGRIDVADKCEAADAKPLCQYSGFGHLNQYPVRMVIKSYRDVVASRLPEGGDPDPEEE